MMQVAGGNQPPRANLNSSLVIESQSGLNNQSALGLNKSLDQITYNPEGG